jgi:cation:H+ antiporter
VIYIVTFVVSGVLVVLAAITLARNADVIAEITELGRLWVGTVLLAGATSLPELTTDLVAVKLDAPDLAVGDLIGSSMANMLILALVDLLPPRRHVLRHVAFDHVLVASLAIALTALAGAFVIVQPHVAVLGIGPGSLMLFVLYLAGTRAVYRHAHQEQGSARSLSASDGREAVARGGLRQALLRLAAATLVVLLAAPAFAWSAKGIAILTGLGNTFVGTWLVGVATSLPELAASLAAVRMGAFDLAVGNLFGSNALNMAIFLPLDLAHPGSLFASIDSGHALSALFAVILMSLGVAAIVFRAERRFGMLEPDSGLMLLTYAAALWLTYVHAGISH